MSVVKLDKFSGLRPSASELRLATDEAIMAENVTLRRGLIAPMVRQLTWVSSTDPKLPIADASTAMSLFRFRRTSPAGDFWMYWTTDVDVAPGPIAGLGTTDQRHYYTGDGAPKLFTADSIDDSTPVYGGSPDSKYPYSWFYLGVPAPAAAPTITAAEYTPPDTGTTGEITSLSAANLLVRIDKWNKTKHINDDSAQNSNIYDQDAIGVSFQALTSGARAVVASVVDEDNVTINGQAYDYVFKMASSDYGLAWASIAGRLLFDPKYQWNFYVPNGVNLEVPDHDLQVGDVIRITTADVPLQYDTTAVMNVNAADKTTDNVSVFQRVNPTSGSIEFDGSISYVIERGGATIDPSATAVIPVETETRSYVYTYVSHLGEEGPPSPPSDPIVVEVGTAATLSGFSVAPTDHRSITHMRIYRASTGTEATEFQFIEEVAIGTTSYVDDTPNAQLGELLATETWDIPVSTMQGVTALPNGALVGFYDNVVCFSEPGYGHAWPEDYQYAIDYNVVSVEVIGQNIVVLTTGTPYVFSGAHSRQMSPRRLAINYSCLDKRAVVNTGDSIIYPSPPGLVKITQSSADVLTAEHYTKEDWSDVVGPDLSTSRILRAWFYDNQYILQTSYTYRSTGYTAKLVFDLAAKLEITSFTAAIEAGFYDPATTEFFYVPVDAPTVSGSLAANNQPLLKWGYSSPSETPASQYVTGVWKSRTFTYQQPISPAAIRCICRRLNFYGAYAAYGLVRINVYGVNFGKWDTATETYVDQTALVSSANVITGTPGSGGWAGEVRSEPFRVTGANALFDAVRVEITLSGPVEVEALAIAEAMEELFETP